MNHIMAVYFRNHAHDYDSVRFPRGVMSYITTFHRPCLLYVDIHPSLSNQGVHHLDLLPGGEGGGHAEVEGGETCGWIDEGEIDTTIGYSVL